MNTTAAPRLVLLLKSGPGSGTSIAHKGGYALYGNPPRWRKITADAPAPKGAPVAAHPKSAGHHEPAAHFSDEQWAALKLPESNVNAPTFNAALEKLKAWSDAGDVTAIVGAQYGSNTYGARLAKLANHLLGLHGSAHKVTPGQKPGTHAASQVAEPADPHPTGLPEHIAPKVAEPVAAPEPTPALAPTATSGPLTMPDFEEGKTTTGVKAHYEHVAQQVVDHGHAGNVSVLENMKKYGSMPNAKGKVSNTWAGKTANSKKLLALHAAAVAHAGGAASEPTKPNLPPHLASLAAKMDGNTPGATVTDVTPAGYGPEPGPKEGDTKPGADGAQLVFKNGRWHKYVAADESGELPPVLVPVKEPAVAPTPDAGIPAAPAAATGSLSAQQLANLQSIPWFKLKLPAENTNAKSHNAALAKIEAMAFAGDVAGLKAFADSKAGAKQTYAKKQHLLAMSALDFLSGTGPTPEQKVRAAKVAAPVEPAPVPAAPAADPYPLVNEWKAAIVAGKVPTKAQAEAYDALTDHDSDAAMEYFMDAANSLIPIDKINDGDFDDALHAAIDKAHELHGHALAGTKPQRAKPAITADTPLGAGQLAALESLSLNELKSIQNAPGLGANVLAWIDKKVAELEKPAAPAKMMIDAPLYQHTKDGHNKFWAVSTLGPVMKTTYGKIGTKGQETAKTFASEAEAKAAAVKLMNEKKAKGYGYAGHVQHEHAAPAATVEQGAPAGSTVEYSGVTYKKNKYGDWVADGFKPISSSSPDHAAIEAAATGASGPKEGDTKQGADGMLVLKNGHWVKVGAAAPATPAINKLTPGQAVKIMASAGVKTAPGNKGVLKAMAVAGDVAGLQAWLAANGKKMPASGLVAKKLIEAMTGGAPVAAPPVAPAAPVSAGGMLSMDGWAQTGGQGGSNPGGKFKDPTGQEWYCKFPKDADTAKSEILAAKLYALAGLSSQDAVLVTKDGKVGIASKWVNIKKAGSPGALAKVDGAQAGFAVDAWLGNWDVVGLAYDNLQVGPDGKAHRVDAGGSLEYRAQGEKKPFGSKVDELDTLLDAGKNAQTASVFKGMTKADMTASAAKVLAISDVAIRAMVNQYGPGDAAAKAKLADTLIARKKDIAAKFPAAAKKKKAPVFKPEDVLPPPSFLNWGGSGKSGPSSKEFLNKANEEAVQAIFAAAKTGSVAAIQGLKAKVFNKDTGAVVGEASVLAHPSQHVQGYAEQSVNGINYQLNPPKKFRFDGGHPLHSLSALYPANPGPSSGAAVQKLGKFIVLGEPGVVKLEEAGLPAKILHAEGGGSLSVHTYSKQAQAAIAKMPATQKQAITAYTGPHYKKMNQSLWAGNPSGAAAVAAEALKTLSHDIEPGTVLSRKLTLAQDDLKQLLAASGKILKEPAIMSTSIRPSSWHGNVQMKLHVGPGVKGLWVGHHSLPSGGALSANSGEDEMILPPGTRLMIIGVKNGADADGFGKNPSHVVEAIILPTE